MRLIYCYENIYDGVYLKCVKKLMSVYIARSSIAHLKLHIVFCHVRNLFWHVAITWYSVLLELKNETLILNLVSICYRNIGR